MSKFKIKILKEEIKPALYTGAVVEDVQSLMMKIDELGLAKSHGDWLKSSVGSHGHEQLNHHMTIAPSPANKIKTPIELDKEIKLKIIGFGISEELGIAAWKVKTDLYVQSGVPHITAMLKDASVKPFLAAKIKEWNPVEQFEVNARVIEVFPTK